MDEGVEILDIRQHHKYETDIVIDFKLGDEEGTLNYKMETGEMYNIFLGGKTNEKMQKINEAIPDFVKKHIEMDVVILMDGTRIH